MEPRTVPEDLYRRLRIYRARHTDVLHAAYPGPALRAGGLVAVPQLKGVPDGAQVTGVQYCHQGQWFEFMVAHPDFDPVPDGSTPPLAPDWLGHWVECYKLAEPAPADESDVIPDGIITDHDIQE